MFCQACEGNEDISSGHGVEEYRGGGVQRSLSSNKSQQIGRTQIIPEILCNTKPYISPILYKTSCPSNNLIKMRKSTSPGFLQQSVWISLSRWGVASKPFEGSSQLCRGEPSKLFLKERKILADLQFRVFSMYFCGGFLILTLSGWFSF